MIETLIDIYVQHQLTESGHGAIHALYAGFGGSTELRLRQDALIRRKLVRRFGLKRRLLTPTKAGAQLVTRWQERLAAIAALGEGT
jgi:hypothetical protein